MIADTTEGARLMIMLPGQLFYKKKNHSCKNSYMQTFDDRIDETWRYSFQTRNCWQWAHKNSCVLGTAGDSLSYHNNCPFTTVNMDNDNLPDSNCAKKFKGAWWYKNCLYSNLNGYYYYGPMSTEADGVIWVTWKGNYYSLKATEMKIRPMDFWLHLINNF